MSSADQSDCRCPICKKTIGADTPLFPFCSDRCRLVDLGRWLDGTYIDRLDRPAPNSPANEDADES